MRGGEIVTMNKPQKKQRGRPPTEYSLIHCSLSLIATVERLLVAQNGENWVDELSEWETDRGTLKTNAHDVKQWIARTQRAIAKEVAIQNEAIALDGGE